jgi:cytochrome c oxidase subunit 2
MSILLGILTIILLYIVVVQIGKASDLIKELKEGEQEENHSKGALFLSVIGFGILIYSLVSSYFYKDMILPEPASQEGVWVQQLITVTLIITGVVFVITQAILFWFVYKYHYRKDRTAYFYPHNNTLEIVWTVIPAIVLTVLIGVGIWRWYTIFNVFKGRPRDVVEVEVTGKQFAWILRYPGKDKKLGKRDFTLVNGDNELGIDWNDPASHDDYISDELVLPKGKTVYANIGALDVIHDFFLPQMRIMMDAVPGVPTLFWFKPTITSAEMKVITKNPNYEYVLACNKLCGSGHYNMQKKMRVLELADFEKWDAEQSEKKSYYLTVVKPAMEAGTYKVNSSAIPMESAGKATESEATTGSTAVFSNKLSTGFELAGAKSNGVEQKLVEFIQSDKVVTKDLWFSFDRLLFETGKAALVPSSQEQLKNVAEIMKAFPSIEIKLGGYTDNVGKPEGNQKLSAERANAVMAELVKLGVAANRLKAEGYGQEFPVASNDTDAGRQQNRRIDIRVTKK